MISNIMAFAEAEEAAVEAEEAAKAAAEAAKAAEAAEKAAGEGGEAAEKAAGEGEGATDEATAEATAEAREGGGREGEGEGERDVGEDPKSKDAQRKFCSENKETCLAIGGATALAAYVGIKYAANTIEQQQCIYKCLPTNASEKVQGKPEYAAQTQGSNGKPNPRCLCPNTGCDKDNANCDCPGEGSSCDTFCKNACMKEYPTDLMSLLPGGNQIRTLMHNLAKYGKYVAYVVVACIALVLVVLCVKNVKEVS